MADKENIIPCLTHAAAKRAAESQPQNQSPAKKKRVALSELPTISNAIIRPPPDLNAAPSKPTLRSEKKEDVEISRANLAAAAIDVDSEMKDSQMCSDIYKYLRSMEVEQKRRPLANYIEMIQTDITANMRGIWWIGWLRWRRNTSLLNSDTFFISLFYISTDSPVQCPQKVSSMLVALYNLFPFVAVLV